MRNIGVVGLGQMGNYYLANIIEKMGISAQQAVIWDIIPDRIAAVRSKYPDIVVAQSLEDFAMKADAFIVTVNTPEHFPVMSGITAHRAHTHPAKNDGVSILCEKPLGMDASDANRTAALETTHPGLRIFTGLVIAFSPVRTALTDLMQNEGLVLRHFGGRWGKNRGSTKESRPTAGDRIDEFIHMLEFGLSLLRDEGIRYADVISQLGFLKYVNADSQKAAHERDKSFPLTPDHATQALISVGVGKAETVQMSLASSFLEARQVRNIWGTFCNKKTGEPVYSFDINFDTKEGDTVYLKRIPTDEEVPIEASKCDKLLALTQAFRDHCTMDLEDKRLAGVVWAGKLVELADALGKSYDRRGKGTGCEVRVTF